MDLDAQLELGFRQAREINRIHGKSYYWATQMFPARKRCATHALYAFFRLADDIVDAPDIVTSDGLQRAQRQMAEFEAEWWSALRHCESAYPVLQAAAYTCRKYGIPEAHSECFLEAMKMDLTRTRYSTYDDLAEYMKGSAASVGLMMSYVIGASDRSALPHLANLGVAMQLTNFLRDVDEDFHDYGRVYLPLEDLDMFGLRIDDIAARRYSKCWAEMMEFQARRAQALYRDADIGIQMINPDARRPVQIASVLYSAILGKLKSQNWNVFTGRAKTNSLEKLVLTVQTMIR